MAHAWADPITRDGLCTANWLITISIAREISPIIPEYFNPKGFTQKRPVVMESTLNRLMADDSYSGDRSCQTSRLL